MQTKFVYGGIFLIILINLSLVTCQSDTEKEAAYYKILPMCSEENIYDIKDLYNPIQIGLQILKRGFCLFTSKIPDKIVEENKETKEISINKNINLTKEEIIKETEATEIKLPIVLPDGFCAFPTGKIRNLIKHKNEHIKCEIKDYENDLNNINEILNQTQKFSECECVKIHDNDSEKKNILHLTIIFYEEPLDDNESCTNVSNTTKFSFLSLDIIFRKSKTEPFVNIPGINYGDPLIKLYEENGLLKVPKKYIQVIPYNTKPESVEYNPFVDNSLTFQDTIIASFLGGSTDIFTKYSKIMNPSNKDLVNWSNEEENSWCRGNEDEKILVFNFLYTEFGAVNNAQKVLLGLEPCKHGSSSAKYLFINFLKKENSKDYWNAPGPRVSTNAKNIMYPFKIGSSNYKFSTSK